MAPTHVANEHEDLGFRRLRTAHALDDAAKRRALDQLEARASSRGAPVPRSAEALARVVLESDGHFTLKALVARERRRGDPELFDEHAVALLVEAGLLGVAFATPDGVITYECAFERPPHEHVVCRTCGTVVEIECSGMTRARRQLAARLGFRTQGFVHAMQGICKNC